jgi:hypothetical protein
VPAVLPQPPGAQHNDRFGEGNVTRANETGMSSAAGPSEGGAQSAGWAPSGPRRNDARWLASLTPAGWHQVWKKPVSNPVTWAMMPRAIQTMPTMMPASALLFWKLARREMM